MAHQFYDQTSPNDDSEYDDIMDSGYYDDGYIPTLDPDEMTITPLELAGHNRGGIKHDSKKSNHISDQDLKRFAREHYCLSRIRFNMYDKSLFFLFQAELFLYKRRYKEALSAALISEKLLCENTVIKAIKMICMYQLNDDKRFRELKEEILSENLEELSGELKRQVVGTIQVSDWIPEFLTCLDNIKRE